ncbi:hypothetical protein [Thermofilum sp.]|uniref:Uncharacterized protein n=1 Tax=Thermofilum adornatum TaxID=1365176 RepID=S6A616_9CREN|nr:hypothetical protein N186_08525 [Thermofilum adornatum]
MTTVLTDIDPYRASRGNIDLEVAASLPPTAWTSIWLDIFFVATYASGFCLPRNIREFGLFANKNKCRLLA